MLLGTELKARGHEIRETVSKFEFTDAQLYKVFRSGGAKGRKVGVNGKQAKFTAKLIPRPEGVVSYTLDGRYAMIARRAGEKDWKLVV